jgi:hypothetical protein
MVLMSNVVNISELKKQFEEKTKAKDLKEFASAQYKIIETLISENNFLKEKNQHLEKMLQTQMQNAMRLSPEEMICLEQIDRLKSKSKDRELTLEEAKKLDILVRNLKLIREESTIVVSHSDPSGIKESELVAIARGPENTYNS